MAKSKFEEWQVENYGNVVKAQENKEAYNYRIEQYQAESLGLGYSLD